MCCLVEVKRRFLALANSDEVRTAAASHLATEHLPSRDMELPTEG